MFNSLTALSTIAYRNKIILAVVCIVVVALILDTSLIKTSGIITSQSGSAARVDFFVIILSITIIGQFLILGFVRAKSVEIRRNKGLRINTIQKIVTLLQSVLTGILIFIILQIVLTSQYNLDMLIAATAISYSLAIAMMVLLTRRFFSWLKPYRNSVILSYCLASAILVTNIGAALFLVVLTLPSNQQQDIVSHLGENIPFLTPGSAPAILDSLYRHIINSIFYNDVDCYLHTIASLFSKIWESQILDSRKHSSDIFSQPVSYHIFEHVWSITFVSVYFLWNHSNLGLYVQ